MGATHIVTSLGEIDLKHEQVIHWMREFIQIPEYNAIL